MKKTLLIGLFALMGLCANLHAQDAVQGVPANVFYLMPQMGQGTVTLKGKGGINGKYNICAIDNTVRFKDKNGTELALEDDGSLMQVIIEGVTFVPVNGVFYRLEKLNDDIRLAIRRDVNLMTDSKVASYGMESNTTAVQDIMGINSDGRTLTFDEVKDIPYRMVEEASLYRNSEIIPVNKKNCIKCFPEKKAEIEAWFKEHKKIDSTDVKAVKALCEQWAE